jgi:hypothetical protein
LIEVKVGIVVQQIATKATIPDTPATIAPLQPLDPTPATVAPLPLQPLEGNKQYNKQVNKQLLNKEIPDELAAAATGVLAQEGRELRYGRTMAAIYFSSSG